MKAIIIQTPNDNTINIHRNKEFIRAKCPICNIGTMDKKEVTFSLYGENLGRFRADVCNKCGEEFFDEDASDRIDEAAKKKGLICRANFCQPFVEAPFNCLNLIWR